MYFSWDSLQYRASLDGIRWLFAPYVGRRIALLEVGVFEGGGAAWFLDNVLTHAGAMYFGVDDNLRPLARENLADYGPKVSLIEGDSVEVLPRFSASVDIAYIDGGHYEAAVTSDLMNAWRLLRRGGLILCDDYNHQAYEVKQAADKFLAGLGSDLHKVVYRDSKLAFTKE